MRFSLTCTSGEVAQVHDVLDQLGFAGRYSKILRISTLTNCSDEEGIRLFAMCVELKQQGLLVEFECKWNTKMEE